MSTLKRTVWPWLTLMSVAKPWMLGVAGAADVPLRAGLPGFVFSHAIGLVIGASHGAAAAGDAPAPRSRAAAVAPSPKNLHTREPQVTSRT